MRNPLACCKSMKRLLMRCQMLVRRPSSGEDSQPHLEEEKAAWKSDAVAVSTAVFTATSHPGQECVRPKGARVSWRIMNESSVDERRRSPG